MYRIALGVVLTVSALAGWPPCVEAAEPRTEADQSLEQITFSTGKKVACHSTYPLDTRNDHVSRAVIVIHGMNRNADDYFGYVVRAARTEGRLNDTLILAPKFQTLVDLPGEEHHFWSGKWSRGDRSLDPARISAFAIIDEIFEKLASGGSLPNLKCIVLAGHSAGGQFVNRYVAGGRAALKEGVETRYLVMNPSTYLYLDGRRAVSAPEGGFEIPQDAGPPDYDDYRYGLNHLNAYMEATGRETIRSNVFLRKAYYLAGTADTGSKNLDQSRGAMAQGQHRYQRWQNYRNYVRLFPQWSDNAVFESAEGIAHSGRDMFNSPEARRILFH